MFEPKYDEDNVNLGFLKKEINQMEKKLQTVISLFIEQNKIQSGSTELATAESNSYIDIQITFDKAFKNVPIVVGTLRGAATSTDNGNTLLAITSRNTTGAIFRYYNKSATTRAMYIDWIAYEK